MTTQEKQAAIDWIVSRDTGLSSIAIWAVMMGAQDKGGHRPLDPADFGRCYRLLKAIPSWRERLPEMVDHHPAWGPLVRHWDKMTKLYEEELQGPSLPKLWDFMRKIEPKILELESCTIRNAKPTAIRDKS